MNKGMLTVGMIMLAISALVLINVITSSSTGSELDYYLVKETAEAAIEDAIDIKYYRDNGTFRMDTEKFVENFLVRFSDSVDNTRNYKVGFYDLNEVPPKVSVKVESASSINFDGSNILISTTYDGIVESEDLNDSYITKEINKGEIGNALDITSIGSNVSEYEEKGMR